MNVLLSLVIYFSVLVFLTACVIRALKFAKAPLHLRWELYPVPHEEPARVKHGGSYFESINWWTHPSPFGFWGELKFMVAEIVFLKSLWEHNRKLWFRSFFFHFGLYLIIVTLATLAVAAALALSLPGVMTGPIGVGLRWLYTSAGAIGLVLGVFGALGLLVQRLTDPDLKSYTTPADIFNLLFFIITFVLIAAGCLVRTVAQPDLLAISVGLLRFDNSVEIPGLLAAGLFLAGILLAYIPMTHMSHFIAKYFTYHSVRWDDSPVRKGGKLEAKAAECLSYKPTWAAAHIGANGKKTWAEIAANKPVSEDRK
jgi:nitrate reductase gamma subunit